VHSHDSGAICATLGPRTLLAASLAGCIKRLPGRPRNRRYPSEQVAAPVWQYRVLRRSERLDPGATKTSVASGFLSHPVRKVVQRSQRLESLRRLSGKWTNEETPSTHVWVNRGCQASPSYRVDGLDGGLVDLSFRQRTTQAVTRSTRLLASLIHSIAVCIFTSLDRRPVVYYPLSGGGDISPMQSSTNQRGGLF
jgi:hypothetical protein